MAALTACATGEFRALAEEFHVTGRADGPTLEPCTCRLRPGGPPIVREQLQKAGVRLAHLLDVALGK
jgi:hypothetical protein